MDRNFAEEHNSQFKYCFTDNSIQSSKELWINDGLSVLHRTKNYSWNYLHEQLLYHCKESTNHSCVSSMMRESKTAHNELIFYAIVVVTTFIIHMQRLMNFFRFLFLCHPFYSFARHYLLRTIPIIKTTITIKKM